MSKLIGTAPNQAPSNADLGDMAYMNRDQVVLKPPASVTPAGVGDMVFELTSDGTVTIKAKGSDGVVRSGTITLT